LGEGIGNGVQSFVAVIGGQLRHNTGKLVVRSFIKIFVATHAHYHLFVYQRMFIVNNLKNVYKSDAGAM